MYKQMTPQLDLPDKFPDWATTAGRTLDPGSAMQGTGWNENKKAPARWMNWIQNYTASLLRASIGGILSAWDTNTSITQSHNNVIWHPNLGVWFIGRDVSTTVLQGMGGGTYVTDANLLSDSPAKRTAAFDNQSNVMFGGLSTPNVMYKSVIVGAWSIDTVTAFVGDTAVHAIETAYPYSSRVLVAGNNGEICWQNQVGGSGWTLAHDMNKAPTRILNVPNSTTWFAFDVDGNCYKSTDDGLSFSLVGSVTAPLGSLRHAAQSPDSGALVQVGANGFYRSVDDGVSWIQTSVITTRIQTSANGVLYMGSGVWLVCADKSALVGTGRSVIYISMDDGVTWGGVDTHGSFTDQPENLWALATNGRLVLTVGANGINIHSGSVGGTEYL
jgi:hypothetical protein